MERGRQSGGERILAEERRVGKLPSRPLGKGMNWDLLRQTKSKGVVHIARAGSKLPGEDLCEDKERDKGERETIFGGDQKVHLARYREALVIPI